MNKEWRVAYINANIKGAEFVTIQFDDFSVLPWIPDWLFRYKSIMKKYPKESCIKGGTGNLYGEWQSSNYKDEMNND